LQRLTGQDDLVLGTPGVNRGRPELEKLIGYFVNLLPVRVRLTDDPSFRSLVEQVRQTVLRTLAYRDIPLQTLVAELQPSRDPAPAARAVRDAVDGTRGRPGPPRVGGADPDRGPAAAAAGRLEPHRGPLPL